MYESSTRNNKDALNCLSSRNKERMHSVAKQETFYFSLPPREAVVRHHFISNPISSKHKTDLSFYIFGEHFFRLEFSDNALVS